MKVFVLALCVAVVAASMAPMTPMAPKRCKTSDDCEQDECCVNYVLTPIFGGRCREMRKEGESCTPLEKNDGEKPDMYHYQCPCKEGLECVAENEIEIFGHIVKHRPECIVPGYNRTNSEVVPTAAE